MLSYNNWLILFILTTLPAYLCGQRQDAYGCYEDLDLYYSLIENERRDSAYAKALDAWENGQSGNPSRDNRAASLRRHIKNKHLFDEYLCIIEVPADSNSITRLLAVADRAAKKHDAVMEVEALATAFTDAFWHEKDYDKAFYIGFRLEDGLRQVSETEYPYKRVAYYSLGEAYYLMHGFRKSIRLLENALTPAPVSFDDRTNLDALNIMGICYANLGRTEISDECFRATLLSGDIVLGRPLYNAYALSHLGCNAMLTGQYDKAIALSDAAWPVLRRETEDYGHLAGMCYCRGRSYLGKKDLAQVPAWIDSLVYFAGKDIYNPAKRIKQAHLLRAEYYTAIGDARRAKIYNDSLVEIYMHGEEDLVSGYIAHASQRFDYERAAYGAMEMKARRIRVAFISIVAICGLALILSIMSLRRRRGPVYRALVRKAGQWAHEGTKADNVHANGKVVRSKIMDEDGAIMSLVEKEMAVRYAYREVGFTAESLAERIGVHRNALSRAINRTTGHNFSHYINSYRIKEAVKIILGDEHDRLYIDELYEQVGFSNRSTFYRTFKQFTGLSPADFCKNKNSGQNN